MVIEQKLLARPLIQEGSFLGLTMTISHDRMLPSPELAQRFVLKGLGLHDIPEGIDAVGYQPLEVEGEFDLPRGEFGQAHSPSGRPETVRRHSRRKPIFQLPFLLR